MTTTKAKVATTIIAVRATALSQGSGLPRICSGISKTSGRQQGKGSDPMHRKDRFIAACNSWSEFWERARKLPSKRQKGDVFERLTQPISRSRTSGATFRLDEVRTYAITVKTTGISTCRGIPFGADGHGVGEADRGRVDRMRWNASLAARHSLRSPRTTPSTLILTPTTAVRSKTMFAPVAHAASSPPTARGF